MAAFLRIWWLGNRCFCFSVGKRTRFVTGSPFCGRWQNGCPMGGDRCKV